MISLEHDLEEALRPAWRFLRQPSDTPTLWDLNVALFGRDVASNDVEECGLAGSVAADETNPPTCGNARGSAFQQHAAGNANTKVVDDEHSAPFG
jgi:hypothetical protein